MDDGAFGRAAGIGAGMVRFVAAGSSTACGGAGLGLVEARRIGPGEDFISSLATG
ncbi:hypothetical protein [Saccharopolyspora spinosa]|uniref:hypothetical protein n=1 Tax=Saccharopolyspora spinosa TaxID=60894 RepID=UPI0002379F4D|nr:hypothetical protein [Saccharopolyspora spinosa]